MFAHRAPEHAGPCLVKGRIQKKPLSSRTAASRNLLIKHYCIRAMRSARCSVAGAVLPRRGAAPALVMRDYSSKKLQSFSPLTSTSPAATLPDLFKLTLGSETAIMLHTPMCSTVRTGLIYVFFIIPYYRYKLMNIGL